MSKKMVVISLNTYSSFLNHMSGEKVSLVTFKKEIDDLYEQWEDNSPENVFFELDDLYCESSPEFKWTYEREETDEEYEARLEEEDKLKEEYKLRRLKQLEEEMTAIKVSMKGESN